MDRKDLESIAFYLISCHDYVQELSQRKAELQLELDLLSSVRPIDNTGVGRIREQMEDISYQISDVLRIAWCRMERAAKDGCFYREHEPGE
jgi:hypothetical protein